MPTREPPSPPESDVAVTGEFTRDTELPVRGTVPSALSGTFLHIGPDRINPGRLPEGGVPRGRVVHVLRLRAGRASHTNGWGIADAAAANIISFGGSIFVLGDGTLAHELPIDRDTARPVDLAGARRSLVAHGHVDPGTGELHLLTDGPVPQLLVTVSRGGLTRSVRAVHDAPSRVRQFEITHDHVVLLAGGFVGLMGRANIDTRPVWFEIDTVGRTIAHAHTHGDSVSVYVDGPSLDRWTLDRRAGTVRRRVLDATPQNFARGTDRAIDVPRRFLWSVGADGVHKHDVRTGGRESHDLGPCRHAGEPVFVADPDRGCVEDGGWLLGFVHDQARNRTRFVVLDAQFVERPAVAMVHVPWRSPGGVRGTWISTTRAGERSQDCG